MGYQVLARKWRPRSFEAVIGQTHIVQALSNAMTGGRVHHAYLFTGTRGVGKTTLARIVAKCLNCATGITAEPCGTCGPCVEIDQGRFVDLIEVDAASRTKVEDTRELLENVHYAPTQGRFKIYLIDEVHMLSTHSFNALLKTLEEPPEHVKFLLATTDPQKLPVTVLSRCLQFCLKPMTPEYIVGHLETLLTEEGVTFDEGSLWALARAANGSMRDALSLTDQAISYGDGAMVEQDLLAMLGVMDRQLVRSLLEAVIEDQRKKALDILELMAEQSADFADVLVQLQRLTHQLALAKTVDFPSSIPESERVWLQTWSGQVQPEALQIYFQALAMGRKDLMWAPDPRCGCEMTVLRMLAFRPLLVPLEGATGYSQTQAVAKPVKPEASMIIPDTPAPQVASPIGEVGGDSGEQILNDRLQRPDLVKEPTKKKHLSGAHKPELAVDSSRDSGKVDEVERVQPLHCSTFSANPDSWYQLVQVLDLPSNVANVARQMVATAYNNGVWQLQLAPAMSALLNNNYSKAIEAALSTYYDRPQRVVIDLVMPVGLTPDQQLQAAKAKQKAEREKIFGELPFVSELIHNAHGRVLSVETLES